MREIHEKIYIPKSFYMNVNFQNFCINTFDIYEQIFVASIKTWIGGKKARKKEDDREMFGLQGGEIWMLLLGDRVKLMFVDAWESSWKYLKNFSFLNIEIKFFEMFSSLWREFNSELSK